MSNPLIFCTRLPNFSSGSAFWNTQDGKIRFRQIRVPERIMFLHRANVGTRPPDFPGHSAFCDGQDEIITFRAAATCGCRIPFRAAAAVLGTWLPNFFRACPRNAKAVTPAICGHS